MRLISKSGWRGIPAIVATAALAGALLVPTLAQQRFSPKASEMREAARRAGVPEHQLPRATPEENRRQRLRWSPWEAKITSEVRDKIAAITNLEHLSLGETEDGTAAQDQPSQKGGKSGKGASGDDAPLRQVVERSPAALSSDELQIDEAGRLFLELKVDSVEPFDREFLAKHGAILHQQAVGYGLFTAWIPARSVVKLAKRPDVKLIRAVGPTLTNIGSVTSEGDAQHRADEARATWGLSGAGQTVGAISDGVTSLAAAQASGDLPATVNVPAGCTGSNDEGTAMLEIIYDSAPGAGLAFCGGLGGATGMINAINTLAAIPGMTAITDDLILAGEPLYEDGPVAAAKSAAVAAGIFYTASAGNRGNQHYDGNFNATASSVTIGASTFANPHDFGGGDRQLSITLASNNSIRLAWAEPYGGSSIDLDLYIIDNAGNVLASSTNTQNGTQDPAESVGFAATAGTAAHIVVDYVGGGAPPTVFFDIRAFGNVGWNEYLRRPGSLDPVARQTDIYVAGAAAANAPNTVRGFSSRGPARRFFPGPMTTWQKPDGVGIDRVLITGAGGFGGGTCPIVNPGDVCRFSGTSASTPHVAALAALLQEDQGGALTPAQIATAFNSTAVDIDAAGPDNNAGFGVLDVYAAICTFDDDDPVITCPADDTAECSTVGGAQATDADIAAFLDGASATDECTDPPPITDDAPGFFPLGPTDVLFTATDDAGLTDSCTATMTVVDTTKPDVSVPSDLTLECSGAGGIPASDGDIQAWLGMASAEDVCDGPLAVTSDAPGFFPAGCPPGAETEVTFSATDGEGNVGSEEASVFVQDTTAPIVNCDVAVDTLWPPDHQYVDVGLTFSASDLCDTDPLVFDVSVTSDEDASLTDGAGGPVHCPDAIIGANGDVHLRSERSGERDGRVYVITVTATDTCGNVGMCSASVKVDHDKGPGGAAVDSGQFYDAEFCAASLLPAPALIQSDSADAGPGLDD